MFPNPFTGYWFPSARDGSYGTHPEAAPDPHERDENGSLICVTCKEPYPYAEAPAAGKFECYSCKVEM